MREALAEETRRLYMESESESESPVKILDIELPVSLVVLSKLTMSLTVESADSVAVDEAVASESDKRLVVRLLSSVEEILEMLDMESSSFCFIYRRDHSGLKPPTRILHHLYNSSLAASLPGLPELLRETGEGSGGRGKRQWIVALIADGHFGRRPLSVLVKTGD